MTTVIKPAAVDAVTDLLCTYSNEQIRQRYANSVICCNCGELGEAGDTECAGCESDNVRSVEDVIDLYYML